VILLIDNYDSFTYNLYQLLARLAGSSSEVRVARNDALTLDDVRAMSPTHLVLTPGPGHPVASGLSLELPTALPEVPLLGVCLGHQALALAYGAKVSRSPRPTHGRPVAMEHDGSPLFASVPPRFDAALYHSLVVETASLPTELVTSAWTASGDIMAIRHARHPQYGVQFHPESFLTARGAALVQTFLEMS
jgi:anthranilate synthase/aminodeoxychorismate synthase-like glutamine amidotransferase